MRGDHPDRDWLQDVGAGIDTWLDEPTSTPTSQLTGGGAVAQAESMLSTMHDQRPTLLMPSATYALWVALRALGVRPGDEVLIPRYDWTSSLAVVLALGATPVVIPVEPNTLTVDPIEAAVRRTSRTRALIATHLFGIPADVPSLRTAVPGLPIVEDCAQALTSTLDGRRVGTLGDAAVFSFGPGKTINAGELGALMLGSVEVHEKAIMEGAHPIRQQLSGIAIPSSIGLTIRPHPIAAVLLCAALMGKGLDRGRADRARTCEYLDRLCWPLRAFGTDGRREIASPYVMFAPDTLTDQSLAAHVGYRDVADIEAVQRGRLDSLRVGTFHVSGPS